MKKGKAYIIGAGPGDFELLTLKAKRIIENADCIVYDRLISEDILKLPKKDAELIYLGKGNTEGGLIQDEINQTLTNKCLEGKNVARVKGGDPFVFGRGGEEIEALFQNEIEFEVIPGITSNSILFLNRASISSPPLPKTKGSPPFTLATFFPSRHLFTRV